MSWKLLNNRTTMPREGIVWNSGLSSPNIPVDVSGTYISATNTNGALTLALDVGTPTYSGEVLSSTTAGVLSWVPQSGGGGGAVSSVDASGTYITANPTTGAVKVGLNVAKPVSNGQVLSSTTGGALSWITPSSGSITAVDASGTYIATTTVAGAVKVGLAIGTPASSDQVLSSTTGGALSWVTPSTASSWSSYPATQDVNFGDFNITNISDITNTTGITTSEKFVLTPGGNGEIILADGSTISTPPGNNGTIVLSENLLVNGEIILADGSTISTQSPKTIVLSENLLVNGKIILSDGSTISTPEGNNTISLSESLTVNGDLTVNGNSGNSGDLTVYRNITNSAGTTTSHNFVVSGNSGTITLVDGSTISTPGNNGTIALSEGLSVDGNITNIAGATTSKNFVVNGFSGTITLGDGSTISTQEINTISLSGNLSVNGDISNLTGTTTSQNLTLSLGSGGVLTFSDTTTLSSAPIPYVLPIATTSVLGGVIPDNTTITITNGGVISAVGGGNFSTPSNQSLDMGSHQITNINGLTIANGDLTLTSGSNGQINLADGSTISTQSPSTIALSESLLVNGNITLNGSVQNIRNLNGSTTSQNLQLTSEGGGEIIMADNSTISTSSGSIILSESLSVNGNITLNGGLGKIILLDGSTISTPVSGTIALSEGLSVDGNITLNGFNQNITNSTGTTTSEVFTLTSGGNGQINLADGSTISTLSGSINLSESLSVNGNIINPAGTTTSQNFVVYGNSGTITLADNSIISTLVNGTIALSENLSVNGDITNLTGTTTSQNLKLKSNGGGQLTFQDGSTQTSAPQKRIITLSNASPSAEIEDAYVNASTTVCVANWNGGNNNPGGNLTINIVNGAITIVSTSAFSDNNSYPVSVIWMY